MEITYLPKEIIDQIVLYSHRYNFVFVCKHFKNMLYKNFIKCDNCGKIVKINNNILWETPLFGECHTTKKYMNTTRIKLCNDKHPYLYKTIIKTTLLYPKNTFITITNKFKIVTKIGNDTLSLKIDIINNNMEYIIGKYFIKILDNDFFNVLKYNGSTMNVLLKYDYNIHTTDVKQVYFSLETFNDAYKQILTHGVDKSPIKI